MLLGQEGVRVAVTYHSERDKAAAVVEKIQSAGSDAPAVQLDLASIESIH